MTSLGHCYSKPQAHWSAFLSRKCGGGAVGNCEDSLTSCSLQMKLISIDCQEAGDTDFRQCPIISRNNILETHDNFILFQMSYSKPSLSEIHRPRLHTVDHRHLSIHNKLVQRHVSRVCHRYGNTRGVWAAGMAGTGMVWEIPTCGYTVPVTAVSWCHTGTCCHGFWHIAAHCVLIPQYCGYFMGKSQ
jgi:hypothetical protein